MPNLKVIRGSNFFLKKSGSLQIFENFAYQLLKQYIEKCLHK